MTPAARFVFFTYLLFAGMLDEYLAADRRYRDDVEAWYRRQ